MCFYHLPIAFLFHDQNQKYIFCLLQMVVDASPQAKIEGRAIMALIIAAGNRLYFHFLTTLARDGC